MTSTAQPVLTAPPSEKRSMNRWLDTVARYGDEGEAWAEDFVARGHDARTDLMQGLLHPLRARRVDEPRKVLAEVTAKIESLERKVCPSQRRDRSMLAVERRFLHGVIAYERYVLDYHEQARQEMLLAYDSVVEAISLDRLALVLANHCQEFRLHIVRIDRNRGDWQAMWKGIEEAQAVVEEKRPLCTLADGSEIYYDALCEFYRSMPAFDDKDHEYFRQILDPEARLVSFENFVGGILRIPGFVIPYS